MKLPYLEVINPCIQICTLDSDSGLCVGCNRTEQEIQDWMTLSPEERLRIIEQLKDR